LFKSTDDGASWFKPNSSIFLTLVVNPINTAILYATGFTGVLKSTNGGGSWGQTALQRAGRSSLAADPQTPSTLYATNPDGLFKTTDGGASWQLSLERVSSTVSTSIRRTHRLSTHRPTPPAMSLSPN
jgi:photosystem II stability/assembly factor-like uncharacterized protein